MTRINSTNSQIYRPFRATGQRHQTGRSNQRITVTQCELVNDEPIEEVIFEPNSGVDQRAMHRGYAITEPAEDVLTERHERGLHRDHFWQGFSTPFMAQVIGQHATDPEPKIRAYARTSASTTLPPSPRLSTAC